MVPRRRSSVTRRPERRRRDYCAVMSTFITRLDVARDRAPAGRQGPHRRGRHADHRRLSGSRGHRRTGYGGCGVHGGSAGGRRPHRGQDQPHGAGDDRGRDESMVRHTCQPARPGTASRVVRRAARRSPSVPATPMSRSGSDTGGSVRIPAACCGIVGLKTTFGRVPLGGVWPLGRTLDTVGPMARDIAGVELGMQLLEPGFVRSSTSAVKVGRIATSRRPGGQRRDRSRRCSLPASRS